MEGIQSTKQSTDNQSVTPKSTAPAPTGDPTDFEITLKSLFSPNQANEVSEEDLFAALVQERIKKEKGEEALEKFQELLSEAKASLTKPDGYIPVEDATKLALTELKNAGDLTADETDSMYSEAFAAAQLDGNEEALFDGRGGADDPTIAVATLEQALLASRVKIEKFDAGELEATIRSVDEASVGKSASHAGAGGIGGGFLFKPESDSEKKLVILLPPKLSGLVESVRLVGPDGSAVETGRYSGNGNGGRDHFRFNRPGGDYPDGLTVEARLKTGEIVKYLIQDTSARTEDPSTEAGQETSAAPATSPASDSSKEPRPERKRGDSGGDLSL